MMPEFGIRSALESQAPDVNGFVAKVFRNSTALGEMPPSARNRMG